MMLGKIARIVCRKMPQIIRRSSFAGEGCLLQFLGIVCFILGIVTILTVIGPIILIPLGMYLAHIGTKKASWYECSECGTKLSGKKIKICPSCRSEFS